MTDVWIGEGTDGTCAGKPVKGAMRPFSQDLIAGCEKWANLASASSEPGETIQYNTSCVLFAVSTIEAKVNEWISIASVIPDAEIPVAFWENLADLQKTLSLKNKWNLIASLTGGVQWESGNEPFQSYETIVGLRNELVHFKGQLLGKDETPNRRIKALMRSLGLKSEATFMEDDVSSWVADLLACKELGTWVFAKIKPFYTDVYQLLLRKP